jgi:molybdopterin molybdotransferase
VPPTFQKTARAESMIPVEEAQGRVLSEVRLLESESIRFFLALDRVLREDLIASRDVPAADNSAMDGYAVIAADVANASQHAPARLRVIGDLPAGTVPTSAVEAGTAIRIMTGAAVPPGCDAVVQVELTDAGSETVSVFKPVKVGANIRKRGEDMSAGSLVVPSGSIVRAAEVGVMATLQKTFVEVGRRPIVAILSTGDELADVEETLEEGKIVNSNAWSLSSLVREAGALPRVIGRVADSRRATVEAIEAALEFDFILSSGGVSAGAFDFVKDALDELGAETKLWQVKMKPGKPLVFATLRDRLYFGLPGNPVSCMVSFLLFVAPAIRKAMGQTSNLLPPVVNARLGGSFRAPGDRRVYNRVRVVVRDGALHALPMRAQGSGVSTSMVGANGLALFETGVTEVGEGAMVPVLLIGAVASEF